MATKKKADRKQVEQLPMMRAWHIILGDNSNATVAAHDCDIYTGVLQFSRQEIDDLDEDRINVLVRAFAPTEWREVELVETPELTAVHTPPSAALAHDKGRH
jgi:hypothetical protein